MKMILNQNRQLIDKVISTNELDEPRYNDNDNGMKNNQD